MEKGPAGGAWSPAKLSLKEGHGSITLFYAVVQCGKQSVSVVLLVAPGLPGVLRCLGHVQSGGDPEVDPEHAGKITFLI